MTNENEPLPENYIENTMYRLEGKHKAAFEDSIRALEGLVKAHDAPNADKSRAAIIFNRHEGAIKKALEKSGVRDAETVATNITNHFRSMVGAKPKAKPELGI